MCKRCPGSAWLVLVAGFVAGLAACAPRGESTYADRVIIRRTSYGVPHILAEDLGAMGYGLAWVHMEDYSELVVERLTMARGELSLHRGAEFIDSDVWWRRRYEQAATAYPELDADTREVYEGYAAGVNRYVALHPEEVPAWARPNFMGLDVAAHWVDETLDGAVRRYRAGTARRRAMRDSAEAAGHGSNSWAFSPGRTASGHAMLLRNPHLAWGAGRYSAYYEAHVTVPDVVDFYGDFRVGYPMYFNGGFNRHLGWSTTNNSPHIEEFYSLAVDPKDPDRYLLDGESVPIDRRRITVAVRTDDGIEEVTRELPETAIGPVVARDGDRIVVVRSSDWGEFRRTEQFLRMMQARDLAEWLDAMRMRAMKESSFIYADGAGNIYYVWNAALPLLPHESSGDTLAVRVDSLRDVWTDLVPYDSLPQLLNPSGGYVHNENDPFHFTSLEALLERPSLRAAWPEPYLSLRSQLALQLVRDAADLTLEDMVALKHSPRMLLADRVKADLVKALRAASPVGEVAAALDVLESWDNSAAAASRGGVLFELWVGRYDDLGGGFAREWTVDEPLSTPVGLDRPDLAVQAFRWAVSEAKLRYGGVDAAWGDVHRVQWGNVDAPVSGCPSNLGCFRHLGFQDSGDGRLRAYTGDAWILAVEFSEPPRAYSVLVYGQTGDPDSAHYDDQAVMFARGELKEVSFTEPQIAADLVRRYRPGR